MLLSSFPEFRPITIDDKEEYERLVAQYPPFSDISFETLHIWWDLDGQLAASLLNSNLILRYHQSFDEENSGLCLVGKRLVDESLDTIFNYLRDEHRKVKLVHVPDFVVKEIKHAENYMLVEELNYNEYILDSKALASLEDSSHGRTRRKVNRFLREVENRKVEIRPLDISTQDTRDQLARSVASWERAQLLENDPAHTGRQAIKRTLSLAPALGIRHLGLYIDEKLYAIIFYYKTVGDNHYTLLHLRVDYSIPFIFDYMTHHIANVAAKDNVAFLNMEMDLGIENLRRHKMGLRPIEFFRKYTVTPTAG